MTPAPTGIGNITDEASLAAFVQQTMRRASPLTGKDIADGTIIGPSVTSLPTSAYDGQEEVYETSQGRWKFKYDSGDDYWYFVGGAPLSAYVATQQTTSSTTYAALATAGPSVTLPLAGDYMVRHGCALTCNVLAADTFHSYDIGATGAVDADSVQTRTAVAASSSPWPSVSRSKLKTGLTAIALVSKYRTTDGAATATIKERWLEVLPVRVQA